MGMSVILVLNLLFFLSLSPQKDSEGDDVKDLKGLFRFVPIRFE